MASFWAPTLLGNRPTRSAAGPPSEKSGPAKLTVDATQLALLPASLTSLAVPNAVVPADGLGLRTLLLRTLADPKRVTGLDACA